MKYILIFALWVGNWGGPATAEFDGKETCEAAIVRMRAEMIGQTGRDRMTFAFCTPKSLFALPSHPAMRETPE